MRRAAKSSNPSRRRCPPRPRTTHRSSGRIRFTPKRAAAFLPYRPDAVSPRRKLRRPSPSHATARPGSQRGCWRRPLCLRTPRLAYCHRSTARPRRRPASSHVRIGPLSAVADALILASRRSEKSGGVRLEDTEETCGQFLDVRYHSSTARRLTSSRLRSSPGF